MKFTKMHGIGNDYIYVYNQPHRDYGSLAIHLCPRHTGIGSDGIIHISHTEEGFGMEMYNADGSQGAMCGNGIRCVGKYLYDQGITQEKTLSILTKAGPRQIYLEVDTHNQVSQVTVNMGTPVDYENISLTVEGRELQGTFVSMGNPHFVLLCQDPQEVPVSLLGSALEKHPHFAPEGVNVEFYSPTEEGFTMRVWERGSGETNACGTGACATFAVGQRSGILDEGRMEATLLGGTLELWQEEGNIYLKGGAVTSFHGEIDDTILKNLVESVE